MANQNQRMEERIALTEQPELIGMTEDGTEVPVHQPPTFVEPGVMDIDTHLTQKRC